MSYNYDVNVSVYTGFFRKRRVGHLLFKDVHFRNPIHKGDWIVIDTESYTSRIGEPKVGIRVGTAIGIEHKGGIGENVIDSSTLYVEYKHRSEFGATLHLYDLGRLEEILKQVKRTVSSQTA